MILNNIARLLVVVGALNWGLVAIGNFFTTNLNIVNLLLGRLPTLENIVYLLVGFSAIVVIFDWTK